MPSVVTKGVLKNIYMLLTILLLAACTPVAEPAQPIAPATVVLPTHTPTIAASATPTSTPTPDFSRSIPEPPFNTDLIGNGEAIYLRYSPSTMSDIAQLMPRDVEWQAVGRTVDNVWLEIQFADDSYAWIVAYGQDVNVNALPITGTADNSPNVHLLEDGAMLYVIPNGTPITLLPRLAPIRLDATNPDRSYINVTINTGQQGWLSANAVSLTQVVDLPQITPSLPVPEITGRVVNDGLRLRQAPTTESNITDTMSAGSTLKISGRTDDGTWLFAENENRKVGWVAAEFVSGVDVASVPLLGGSIAAIITQGNDGIRATSPEEIFRRGQALGNRPNVFTTVGDSITDTEHFLRQIQFGYNLGEYAYLAETVRFFNVDTGYGLAFGRRPFPTRHSWTTQSVLDPANAPPLCAPNESPLVCEYRLVKPSTALIMLGTNNVYYDAPDIYRASLREIIDTTIEYGVIPVLSTLPPRKDQWNAQITEYNQIIRSLATAYNIPLWDFRRELENLPNQGISPDGVHLSLPDGAPRTTMVFTNRNLQSGSTLRNLSALRMLERLRQQVLQ